MLIEIKLPPEIEAQLVAEAKARGLSVEAYVEEILSKQIISHTAPARRPRTPEEIRAWLDSLAQFSDKIPPLPETISRAWIYQDHD